MLKSTKPTAIDLYCGIGGLTLGLKKAGFDVLAGLELDPSAAKTYKANHGEIEVFIEDIRNLTGKDIMKRLRTKKIDLIAGCPPCQGFSSLTNKYKRKDPRNDLALDMVRIIKDIKPKMVMMENVPGLAKKGRIILNGFLKGLKKLGYLASYGVLQLADYGIPQSRRRFVLLAGKGFNIPFPKQTHCLGGDKERGLKPRLVLSDVIKGMGRPLTMAEANRKGGPQKFNWHVVRDLKETTLKRMRALSSGSSRDSLPKHLRPKCHRKDDKGFKNVYGRLSWNMVPPTITSGCTTMSMGRFGHPKALRTISVREAALIQTFPKKYIFDTPFMNAACILVANALPPKFAEKVARSCLNSFNQLKP